MNNLDNYILLLRANGHYDHLNILKGKRSAALITALDHEGHGYCWTEEKFMAQTKTGDTSTNEIKVYQNIPKRYSKKDGLLFFVSNNSVNPFLLDSFSVSLIKMNE
jgi:hypothetical protein